MRAIRRPELVAAGAMVFVKYRSVHETKRDRSKSVAGFVVDEEEDVLVVEEYHNFDRTNDHRHVLVDTETMDVFSQTPDKTSRIGQVDRISVASPPWDSKFDTTAAGAEIFVADSEAYHMVEEGAYRFPDPSVFSRPDDWDSSTTRRDPLPEKMVERNPETSYAPEWDFEAVK